MPFSFKMRNFNKNWKR